MKIAPLNEETAPAWAALFEAAGSTCFCRWWHFEGTKNEWLARGFEDSARNRDEQRALALSGAPSGHGLLALEGTAGVGWMKLAPRAALPKLLRQGPYRSLDLGDGDGVWSVGCLLVHPAWRRRGVARALVSASFGYARHWGGRAVEAYPRRVDHVLHDEQAWMGTVALFASLGFTEVAGDGPYPVLRKEI